LAVEHLYPLDVANVNSTFAIDGDRGGCSKLTRLFTTTAKAIDELPIRTKLEDGVIEGTQRINIAQAIDCHAGVQLRCSAGSTDRSLDSADSVSPGIEAHNIIPVLVPRTHESAIGGSGDVVKARAATVLQFTQLLS